MHQQICDNLFYKHDTNSTLARECLYFCLTFWSPFFGAFPQELQEELLSCEAVLFHISPSSSSHWLVLRFTSSPPLPQPSCIDFEAGGKVGEEKYYSVSCKFHRNSLLCHIHPANMSIFKRQRGSSNSLNGIKMVRMFSLKLAKKGKFSKYSEKKTSNKCKSCFSQNQ